MLRQPSPVLARSKGLRPSVLSSPHWGNPGAAKTHQELAALLRVAEEVWGPGAEVATPTPVEGSLREHGGQGRPWYCQPKWSVQTAAVNHSWGTAESEKEIDRCSCTQPSVGQRRQTATTQDTKDPLPSCHQADGGYLRDREKWTQGSAQGRRQILSPPTSPSQVLLVHFFLLHLFFKIAVQVRWQWLSQKLVNKPPVISLLLICY